MALQGASHCQQWEQLLKRSCLVGDPHVAPGDLQHLLAPQSAPNSQPERQATGKRCCYGSPTQGRWCLRGASEGRSVPHQRPRPMLRLQGGVLGNCMSNPVTLALLVACLNVTGLSPS